MRYSDKLKGGALSTIGFMLSPLSWWNDIYINFPIAYFLAWLISLIDKDYFQAALIISYWFSNLFGVILFHKGMEITMRRQTEKSLRNRKELFIDLAVSILYTLLMIVLIRFDILRLPEQYLGQ